MKWLQERLRQCIHGQNGHSQWNKRAATIWNDDTESARILQEEMEKCEQDNEIAPQDTYPCDDLLKKHTPRIITKAIRSNSIDTTYEDMKLDVTSLPVLPAATRLAPGLISVASCDTDEPESLALQLLEFNVTAMEQTSNATSSPVAESVHKKNMRMLSLLRNVRRLEKQYLETGNAGRMLPSTIVEMPVFQYTKPATPNANSKCSICLHDFNQDEELRVLRCLHIFHSGCIDQWLLSHSKCPICVLSP
ncbi:hypothetical protein THRCLA_10583 [Thraustotheca clavata]|uniref:RING-type domain-containing protein n=1 Tax=Thraustotheca clavata TaxID=74557 RepID=A0A1V9YK08_9STRA|nr:hypothetical protein THRCLA_10583 [Thraustotheca clavata]